jgi:hypothetical protein
LRVGQRDQPPDVTDPAAKPFGAHLPEKRRLGATEFAASLRGAEGEVGVAMVEHMLYGRRLAERETS